MPGRFRHLALSAPAAALAVTLAACAGESAAPPVSTDAVGPPSQMPQSANSLPRGSTVAAPIVSPRDALQTTQVGGPSAAMPTSSDPQSSPRSPVPRRVQ